MAPGVGHREQGTRRWWLQAVWPGGQTFASVPQDDFRKSQLVEEGLLTPPCPGSACIGVPVVGCSEPLSSESPILLSRRPRGCTAGQEPRWRRIAGWDAAPWAPGSFLLHSQTGEEIPLGVLGMDPQAVLREGSQLRALPVPSSRNRNQPQS